MDFGLQSARNRRAEPLDAGYCDITSLLFHRRGRYDFGLTLHGFFVPPASHTTTSSAPIEQPRLSLGRLATIGLDEDSLFGESGGLRAIFSNGVSGPHLEHDLSVAASRQANEQSEHFEPIPGATLEANFEFDFEFPSQVETNPPDIGNKHHDKNYQTAADDLFLNELEQDDRNNIFGFEIPVNPYTPGTPTPEIDFSNSFETSRNVNPETSLSFNESNLTTILSTPSPSSPTTTPSSSSSSPGRHFCRLCSATFKRAGDLKRHEKVHFPEQRNFHCWQLRCERNGRKGFYRRDKLRAHERQVHGL